MRTDVPLILLFAALIAVATPTPPRFSPQFKLEFTTVIPAEGVSVDNVIAHFPPNKISVRRSGSDGYYASLYRNDLGKQFYYHDINGTQICVAVSRNSTVITPNMDHIPYAATSYLYGRPTNVFRLEFNKYIWTIYGDAATGHYAGSINTETMNSVVLVNQYTSDVPEDDPLFDVPPSCTNPMMVLEGAAVDAAGGRPPLFAVLGGRTRALYPSRDAWMKHLSAVVRSTPDLLYAPTVGAALPPTVDNSHYATPVRDQSQCGGCWAFSTTALSELVRNKARGTRTNYSASEWLSVQSILDCVTVATVRDIVGPFGCQGGSPLNSLLHIASVGIPAEADYPYTAVDGRTCRLPSMPAMHHPIAAAKLVTSQTAGSPATMLATMMDAVYNYGGLVGAINEIPGPMGDANYAGGVYSNPACVPGIAHAITVVGYGSDDVSGLDYWLVKNSFGGAWGEGGYFRMARGINMCGIEDFAYIAVPN